VLTYTDKATGISVDLSFGTTDPSGEVTTVNAWAQQYPLFRDLTLLLKLFFEVRRLLGRAYWLGKRFCLSL
jgi:DNA polymerase sigma